MKKKYPFTRVLVLCLVLALMAMVACQSTQPVPEAEEPAEEVAATEAPAEEAEEPVEEAAEPTEEAVEPTEEPAETTGAMADPLIVLIDNDEGPISPANFNTFIGYYLVGWVYDELYTRSPELEPIPNLATGATASEDGLTWTMTLRDDVNWHDGEPFTADDVVFSYNFLIAAGRAPNLAAVDTVEATGDHEVTITLTQPSPFFINEGLAGYFILPEHIWVDQEPVSGELSQFQGMVGTGPFVLQEVAPGESYTFVANADYFRGTPTVPNLIAKIVKDRTQQFNQLRSGEAHAVLSSVPPAQVDQISGDAAIQIATGADFFNYVYYMNGSRPPFDQIEVRQAIGQAIDTATLVEVVMLGRGVELPLSWYHPDLPHAINIPRGYDPEGAAALLDEAGLTDSDGDGVREFNGEPAAFTILCDVNNPVEVRTTELISGMLSEVGFTTTQNCQDIDTSVAQIWPNFVAVPDPDYDMAIWGWSSGVQFQRGFLRGLLDGDFGGIGWGNLTGVADPELDELTAEYVVTSDLARVEELNVLIQERIAERLPLLALMSPAGNFAYRAEAYDGWVYVRGTGIMTRWSFLPPLQ